MKGKYRKSRAKSKQSGGKPSEVQLPLERDELVEMLQDGLSSFATEMGLLIAVRLLEDEVQRRCGARHERLPDREVTRYGRQQGWSAPVFCTRAAWEQEYAENVEIPTGGWPAAVWPAAGDEPWDFDDWDPFEDEATTLAEEEGEDP